MSGEWWRQYADEVAQHPDVAACFFILNEAQVAQILEAFRAPVPTGASSGPVPYDVGQKARGIVTALLPAEDRAMDADGILEGMRAARQTL